MNVTLLSSLIAMAAPQSQEGGSNAPWWTSLVPLLLIFVVMYIALILPQQRKAKQHAELVKSLNPGDKVVTNGGIHGIIVSVKDKTISIRSADSKLEVLRSAVTEVTEKSSQSGSN